MLNKFKEMYLYLINKGEKVFFVKKSFAGKKKTNNYTGNYWKN